MVRRRPTVATPRDVQTEWWWPPSPTIYRTTQAGFASFEHIILPEIDPGPDTSFVMAHEFKLAGGDGGMVGLETGDGGTGSGLAKCAVFSIVNAVGADNGSAGPGTGEGSAWSCRVLYPWEAGRSYRMRLWSDEPGWWSATLTDLAAGREDLIGRIRVPNDWRQLAGWSVMATRYRNGPVRRCDDLAECRVAYQEPTANDGRIQPVRHENHLGPGTCECSRVADVRGGVRHEIGGPV
ncbi:MAG: hypothetical protein M3011_00075 [Actinomycetota bacterium]|nr:hypothetical protein [Actinomycetota bacterium]